MPQEGWRGPLSAFWTGSCRVAEAKLKVSSAQLQSPTGIKGPGSQKGVVKDRDPLSTYVKRDWILDLVQSLKPNHLVT